MWVMDRVVMRPLVGNVRGKGKGETQKTCFSTEYTVYKV